MHITELRIRNFRNFMAARFRFRKGVNTLIGENGSGKTNALHALRLLLDDNLLRSATRLREQDFCRALGDWRGHWAIIVIDFAEVDPSEGCQLLKHETGHMDGTETGTYSFYFRPKLEIRTKLHELTEEGNTDEITEVLHALTVENYEPVFTGRAQSDLLDDTVYKQVVGDFENLAFSNPADDDVAVLGVRMGPIHLEVTCTFAKALRDVVSDLRGYRNNPLLGLLRGTESEIRIEDAERITNAVSQLNEDISSLPEIENIADGVQATLESTVGNTFSPKVSIESALPDDLERLLQRLSLKASDGETDYREDMTEQGLGAANLIYIALKLLEYETKLSTDRVAHFLLIEEPEAHIHTHIQKTLFASQAARNTQVIVSSHSTHISSVARIRSVNVLARKRGHAEVFQPANGLEEVTAARVERYLDAVRSNLLFAKGVVLVEGEAELVLVPGMVKAVLGTSLDELGISVVAMGSAFFENIAIVFQNDRIRRRCSIISDGDRSILELPDDPGSDTPEEKHARASEKAGENRKEALAEFTDENEWIEFFLAEHTLEVDFLVAGNQREMKTAVDAIYSRESDQTRAKKRLDAEDISVSGTEALRLATKLGKGWFSLLLAETLHTDTFIPDYILRAIAFACAGNVTDEVIKRIGMHRLRDEYFDEDLLKSFEPLDEMQALPSGEFKHRYVSLADEDVLTVFVNYLEEYDLP